MTRRAGQLWAVAFSLTVWFCLTRLVEVLL